ncbi:MAG: Superfamily and helicase, partial [Klenkia sp.]|nr:Superfamily and helicase [Klenkia sp.]
MTSSQTPNDRPRRRATSPAGAGGGRPSPSFRSTSSAPAQPLVTRHEPAQPEVAGAPGTGRRRRGGRGLGTGDAAEQPVQ